MTEQPIEIPLYIVGADEVPIVFSNLMMVQHEQREFILTFCQFSPPLVLGSPEAQAQQVKSMPYVPVKVVSRVGLTPERMNELIEALKENYAKWQAKQQGGEER